MSSNVYDRLTDPRSYTGVYAARFEPDGDGRINAETDTSARAVESAYVGNTNTNTDETIRDIAYLMRPNLKADTGMAFTDKEVARRIHKKRQDQQKMKPRHVGHRANDHYVRRGRAANMRRRSISDHEANVVKPVAAETSQKKTIDIVRDVFLFYCRFGRTGGRGTNEDSMDSFMFMKFIKECPNLIGRRELNRAEVDLIFTKAKPKHERRLDFKHFLDALGAIAIKRYPDMGVSNALNVLIVKHVFELPCVTGIPPPPSNPPSAIRSSPPPPPPAQSTYARAEAAYAEQAHRRAVQQLSRNPDAFYGRPGNDANHSEISPAAPSAAFSRQDWERLHAHASDSAHIAGEANKKGGVYDRLSSTKTFTGVYKRRFDEGDGRIGHHADMHLTAKPSSYVGNTNTGTDETIHDISRTFRTNLGVGTPGAGRYMRF